MPTGRTAKQRPGPKRTPSRWRRNDGTDVITALPDAPARRIAAAILGAVGGAHRLRGGPRSTEGCGRAAGVDRRAVRSVGLPAGSQCFWGAPAIRLVVGPACRRYRAN